jgi:hypothetical protein
MKGGGLISTIVRRFLRRCLWSRRLGFSYLISIIPKNTIIPLKTSSVIIPLIQEDKRQRGWEIEWKKRERGKEEEKKRKEKKEKIFPQNTHKTHTNTTQLFHHYFFPFFFFSLVVLDNLEIFNVEDVVTFLEGRCSSTLGGDAKEMIVYHKIQGAALLAMSAKDLTSLSNGRKKKKITQTEAEDIVAVCAAYSE